MSTQPPLDASQFQQLVNAINNLKPDASWHWLSAIPIFLSSLSGLVVGIFVGIITDKYKRSKDVERAKIDKQTAELQQIKVVLASLSHNVTALLHIVAPNLLPHFEDSQAAYAELLAVVRDATKWNAFAETWQERYPNVTRTCPPMYFIEYDFLEKLPFLTEKDINLVADSNTQIQSTRALVFYVSERTKIIENTRKALMATGMLSISQIHSSMQSIASLAVAECVTAIELFEAFFRTAESLRLVMLSYNVEGEKKGLLYPPALEHYLVRLRAIRAEVIKEMPA
jgi:hypothetical protein